MTLLASFEPAIFEDVVMLIVVLEQERQVLAETAIITAGLAPGLCKARVAFKRKVTVDKAPF